MKSFSRNKEVESILDDLLEEWRDDLLSLEGKQCVVTFSRHRIVNMTETGGAKLGQVYPNMLFVDLSDFNRGVRKLCSIYLYSLGFKDDDLKFDLCFDRPIDIPELPAELPKCECGAVVARTGHSDWCPVSNV